MKKRIVITKNDIENGQRYKTGFCPVALACKRGLKTNNIIVGYELYINGKFHKMPKNVGDFTIDFDLNRPVKPFQFTVEI